MGKRINAVRRKLAAWIAPSLEMSAVPMGPPQAPLTPLPPPVVASIPVEQVVGTHQPPHQFARKEWPRDGWNGHPHDRPEFNEKVEAAATRLAARAEARRKISEKAI